ncbi:MAG: protein translocase subunit SecD [Deltaproteobacteria bacterium]|nr:protein translocase subunit SecD [Deltaproteobacteria bacterium]
MEKSWYWRLLLVSALVALSAAYAAPSAIYLMAPPEVRKDKAKLEEITPEYLPKTRISLGIDLQGGLHLVMGVDAVRAVQNRADHLADEIFEHMKEKGVPIAKAERPGESPEVRVELAKDADFAILEAYMKDRNETWELRSHSGTSARYGMKPAYETQLMEDAVAQAQKTLRNRIDTYGVTEPEVRKSGRDSVLIQVAGLGAQEATSFKDNIIGKTAQLEFKMVDDENNYVAGLSSKLPEGVTAETDSYRGENDRLVTSQYLLADDKEKLKAFVEANPPPADRVVRYEKLGGKAGPTKWRTWLLDRKTPLTGDSLVNAFVAFNNDESNYYVAVKFDRRGADVFAKLTGENIKKRMAIVLDEIVDSAPVIQSKIPNGNCSITLGGGRTQQEVLEQAKDLQVVLNAGALPAPVYPREERSVGATLGEDAIIKGNRALLATTIVVIATMVGYYKLSGVISVLALAINMLLLFACLAGFGATLTLPGLAGIVLTIGMAVDANIVQFERIREELRGAKSVRQAVDLGFDRAFTAIFDSNVTTLLSAIVLYQYGSGPLRGFATTLGMGVVINTFTAVVVPRLVLEYLTRAKRIQALSI